MRVFIFTFLLCFFATTRLCALTFLCTNRADYACKVLNLQDTSITRAKSCNQLKSISQDTILYYSHDLIKQCNSWDTDIKQNKNCPYVTYEHMDDDNGEGKNFVFFCITNPNVLVAYTSQTTTSWSYDQKKCVGSGGIWTNDTCDCTNLPDTTKVENECLCTNNDNQQYFGRLWSGCNTLADGVKAPNGHTIISGFGDYKLQSIDKINSCSPSGGTWSGPKENTCLCNGEINLELDTSEYFCKCKDGTHYIDPLEKYRGCTEKKDIVISGTVVNYTNNTALNGVRVFVANDESITTTTDTSGQYTLKVPNNADITFALSGYQPQTISATYLEATNTPIRLVPAPYEIADHEITEGNDVDDNDNITNVNSKTPEHQPNTDNNQSDNDKATNQTSNSEIPDRLKESQAALDAARDAETSLANRLLTTASTAATGAGAMMAASALAEQNADADAERDMRAYIETMKCEYGGGQIVTMGNEDVTLPGGNELLTSYREYKQLADNLKTTKKALNLRSGIESEVLYDRAQSGLYQYASVGKTGGGETSVYRALTDTDSADALAWAEQKEKSAKQLKTGAIVAGAGVATGVIGNYLVNERGEKNDTNETDIDEIAARAGNALGRNRNNKGQPEQPHASAQVSQTIMITWRKMFKNTNSTDIDAGDGNNEFAISVNNIVKALQSDTTGADTQCVTVRSRPSNFAEILTAKYKDTLLKQFTKSKIEYRINNTEITDTACTPDECPNIYINVRNKPCGKDVRIPNNTKFKSETVTVSPPADPQPNQPEDTASTRIINQWKQEFRNEHYATYKITPSYATLFEFIKDDTENSHYKALKAECDKLIEAEERYDWHIAGDKKVNIGDYGTVVIDKYICDGYH